MDIVIGSLIVSLFKSIRGVGLLSGMLPLLVCGTGCFQKWSEKAPQAVIAEREVYEGTVRKVEGTSSVEFNASDST